MTGAGDVVSRWRALAASHAAVTAALEHDLGARHGLGVTEFEVLERLAEDSGHKFRVQELAESVHLSQSALSRLIGRLEQHGLVQRSLCDADRRGIYVCLTEAGRRRHAEALPDVLGGGARRIPVDTPKGTYQVWVKRIGNNPRLRVLLLHGGPGSTHEYLEACDSFLPAAGVEYYYYDQLGSGFSDQPEEPSLWELDRFVDEVEQVRQALGLDADSFVLYGQSWGGILGMEYALAHQEHLRGLVISNMMASVPAYNAYAEQVLMPKMDAGALAEIKALEAAGKIEDPRYMELLAEQHYIHHVLRIPEADWPDPVRRGFAHINPAIYVSMQGPSELGISADAKLAHWDRFADLGSIEVPTLVIGARHDTMDPAHMEAMAAALPKGRYLHCPDGSHLAMYDDQQVYFSGLVEFLHDLAKQP